MIANIYFKNILKSYKKANQILWLNLKARGYLNLDINNPQNNNLLIDLA